MMAQGAALKEVANSKLRRLLAYNKTFNCADIKVGDLVLFYKAPHRKSRPRWRGPALLLDIDETGATVKYQTQSFKVARYCVRKQVKANSDGSGSEDCQDDARLRRMDPISQDILGDTWRNLESMEGSVPAVACPSQGVIDVESLDSSPKVAVDPPSLGTDSTTMCIDSQGPAEDVIPGDIPVPPSPSSTYSWTPLFDRH